MRQDILIIIPCSKIKIWDKNPKIKHVKAKDAYISPYFKLCRRFAERIGASWLIFSAKYGLISPEFIIPNNYDVSFNRNYDDEIISKTIEQAKEHEIYNFNKIYSLCGENYNKILRSTLRVYEKSFIIPFPEDMRTIGKRQRWVKHLCVNPHLLP